MANLYWPKRSMFRSERARRRRFEQRLDAAEAAAKDVLVITHGHCLDGVGAAIMAMRGYGADKVGVAYAQPSDVHRVLQYLARFPAKERTLHVTDLSFNPQHYETVVAAVQALQHKGWRIEWRDHHEKQWEDIDLARLATHLDALEVNQDHTESGASLAQKAMCPRDKYAQRLADTIKDRDLWWNQTPDSEMLEFAISQLGEEKFIAHCLSRGAKDPVVDDVIAAAAKAHQRQVEQDAKKLLRRTRYYETSEGERVGVVYGWLPKNVGLHRVLEDENVQVAVNVRPNGHMSIRSRKGADVSQKVAKQFDGGGHPNASGGTLGLHGVGFWNYVLRRGRTRSVDAVGQAAVQALEAREEE